MSDGTISIPIERLRHVGGEFKAASSESLEIVGRLQQAVQALDPEWDGVAKQAFYQQWRQWETTLRQFAQLLETAGGQLDRMASDFSETELELRRKMEKL